MKGIYLSVTVCFLLAFCAPAWGVCPQDSVDSGKCDTMYVEPWDSDTLLYGNGPYFVRIPIYITNDLVSWEDSIAAFMIPFCFSHSNPAKYCSLSLYWNNVTLSGSSLPRSVFRHLDGVTNRMLWLFEQGNGEEWDTRVLKVASDSVWYRFNGGLDSLFVPPHFWLGMLRSGPIGRLWWEGSRTLLATMTLKLEDTMQICIDTCFWPPTGQLAYFIWSGDLKVPRLGDPHDPGSYRMRLNFRLSGLVCGDADGDGSVDVGDVVYLANYLFKGGLPPNPLGAGDVNDDGIVDVTDVVYLVNYVFKGGLPPSC
jgi:hypothetical protein